MPAGKAPRLNVRARSAGREACRSAIVFSSCVLWPDAAARGRGAVLGRACGPHCAAARGHAGTGKGLTVVVRVSLPPVSGPRSGASARGSARARPRAGAARLGHGRTRCRPSGAPRACAASTARRWSTWRTRATARTRAGTPTRACSPRPRAERAPGGGAGLGSKPFLLRRGFDAGARRFVATSRLRSRLSLVAARGRLCAPRPVVSLCFVLRLKDLLPHTHTSSCLTR
jgi:hypothetical protein